MLWTVFLYGLVPLAAFVAAEMLVGMRAGLAIAFILAVVEIFVMRQASGSWDPVSFTAAGLIAALGAVSLKLENSVYFKFQPVVLGVCLAGFIAYLQFFDTPVVYRYLPLIQEGLPESMRSILKDRQFLAELNSLFTYLIWIVLLHSAWIAYAALRCSNLTWLLVRGLGLWVLAIAMLILRVGYMLIFPVR